MAEDLVGPGCFRVIRDLRLAGGCSGKADGKHAHEEPHAHAVSGA